METYDAVKLAQPPRCGCAGARAADARDIARLFRSYAREVVAAARRMGLRVELDLRNEKINYKVREHSLAKVPALLVVGRNEAESRQVSVRRLGSERQSVTGLDAALAALVEEATAPDVARLRATA